MNIWDFEISHKIAKWTLIVVALFSLLYGVLTGNIERAKGFLFSSVKIYTDSWLSGLQEAASSTGEMVKFRMDNPVKKE